MLFEGTSARKHEINKELPHLVMTNHSKLRKPCQQNSITALFQQMGPIITFLHHTEAVLHAFFCISSENFGRFSNGSGILENSQNREPNRSQNWRTGTGLNRTFGSVPLVPVLCISSELNFGNTTTLNERLDFLRKASDIVIFALVDSISELWTCLPQDYLRELGALDHTICLRSSLVCWAISQGRMVPREMQLRSILADQQGWDSSISAGTGSGKTLPITLCTLLDDPAKKRLPSLYLLSSNYKKAKQMSSQHVLAFMLLLSMNTCPGTPLGGL